MSPSLRRALLWPAALCAALGLGAGAHAAPVPVPEDMVAFPAGPVIVGCEGKLPVCDDDEQPPRRVQLSAFAIDRDLVTKGQYLACVNAKACTPPPLFYAPERTPDVPMTDLTFADAEAVCAWRGRRLPTEAEWTRAAQGPDGRTTVGPGRRPTSPEGVRGLMGVAKQWVADWYDPEGYGRLTARDPAGLPEATRKTVRGLEGHVRNDRASFRASRHPDRRDHGVGVRCALTLDPARRPTPSVLPPPASGPPWRVRQVAAGEVHTCALDADGAQWCWGNDRFGQLGPLGDALGRPRRGRPERQLRAQAVAALPRFSALAAGPLSTCGRTTAGALLCWGKLRAIGHVADLAVGDRVCALTGPPGPLPQVILDFKAPPPFPAGPLPPGRLACSAPSGAFSDGGPLALVLPDPQAPDATARWQAPIKALATANRHACLVDADGAVWCWGENGVGQLGVAPDAAHAHPVRAGQVDLFGRPTDRPMPPATAVALGSHHTCALHPTGRVSCWGRGTYGALGVPFRTVEGMDRDRLGPLRMPAPLPVAVIDDAQQLSAGTDHTCAVRADASLWCWGDNRGGQLGDGTVRARRTAAPVLGLPAPVRQVSLGHSHSCAVLTDDSLWCWGENDEGQLGDGTRVSRRLPVRIAAPR